MTAKTRFSRIGLSDRKDSTTNSVDSYKEIIEVPITIVAAATAQVTDVVLPANCLVSSATVYVGTAEATGLTKTISCGIDGGSGTAFVNAASVAATGMVAGATAVAGNGATVNYTLGSADFAELDAVILLEIIAK